MGINFDKIVAKSQPPAPTPAPASRPWAPPVEPAREGAPDGATEKRGPAEVAPSVQFPAREARRNLDALIVAPAVRAQISSALVRLSHQHTLHEVWGLAEIDPYGQRTVLNLYGPPGTGKTLCAEAIAGHLGRPFLDVNYAELESKFVGETAKNIVRVFAAAREQGAVLFFDEADSLLGKRLTEVRQSSDYGVNQSRSVTLKQLEAFEGVVIFATNMAKQYDGAFVRRILAHIHLDLPDDACRVRLWERFLVPKLPRDASVTASTLAALSHGLSGGELLNALINAAGEAVALPEAQRHLTLALMRRHVEEVQRARREVGSSHEAPRAVMTEVTREALPPEAQARLEAKETTSSSPDEGA